MAKREHSTGVSDEFHSELLDSINARDKRRQEQLAKLPIFIGTSLRGRIREGHPVVAPRIIPKDMAISLGRRLQKNGEVLRDQFTENIPTLRQRMNYEMYVMGGNKRNKRIETDPEEQKQAVLALQRQTLHVADKLHQDTWREWQLAKLFRAGVAHVRDSQARGTKPRHEALRLAASATEDLGFCLEGDQAVQKLWGGKWLPMRLIEIGQHAANEPQTILIQSPELLLVVQREQERREGLWGDNLTRYEDPAWGGDRRTTEDHLDEVLNDTLIAQLQVK